MTGLVACLLPAATPAAGFPRRFWGVVPQIFPSTPQLRHLRRKPAWHTYVHFARGT